LDDSPGIRLIKSRRMKGVGHVAHMGDKTKILVGKPEGKRTLGRRRRRWEDNIRMDLGEMRLKGADWMYLAQDRGK